MDRRKFITTTAAATIGVPMTVMAAKETQTEVIRYKTAEDTYWHEDIHGESVEFGIHYDFGHHMVRVRWRSMETPRKTYALGHIITDEMFEDSMFGDIRDMAKVCEGTQTLRIAIKNSIMFVKYRPTGVVYAEARGEAFAPHKPEGGAFPVI